MGRAVCDMSHFCWLHPCQCPLSNQSSILVFKFRARAISTLIPLQVQLSKFLCSDPAAHIWIWMIGDDENCSNGLQVSFISTLYLQYWVHCSSDALRYPLCSLPVVFSTRTMQLNCIGFFSITEDSLSPTKQFKGPTGTFFTSTPKRLQRAPSQAAIQLLLSTVQTQEQLDALVDSLRNLQSVSLSSNL